MPVQIRVDTDVTLADLVKKKEQGYIVEETPHVGNLSVSTLAMLTLGFRAKLVDVTIGSKDNLFWPHCVIVGGEREMIADPSVMTTHNTVAVSGMRLDEFHLRPFVRMVQMRIFVHSDWVAKHRQVIHETIEATSRTLPFTTGLWTRYVDREGLVTERKPNTFTDDCGLQTERIHKVNGRRTDEGWVVPNPFNILFDLVCGSLESQKSTVYMLSGQSMYRYIAQPYRHFGPMDALISTLYDAARDQAFPQLPEHLEVVMVPVPVVRNFVAPLRLKNQLDRKLECYHEALAGNAHSGKKFSLGELSHSEVVGLKQERGKALALASQPLASICADSETGTFYSQHDMDRDQDSIYIPGHVMEMSIREMLHSADRMRRLSA